MAPELAVRYNLLEKSLVHIPILCLYTVYLVIKYDRKFRCIVLGILLFVSISLVRACICIGIHTCPSRRPTAARGWSARGQAVLTVFYLVPRVLKNTCIIPHHSFPDGQRQLICNIRQIDSRQLQDTLAHWALPHALGKFEQSISLDSTRM